MKLNLNSKNNVKIWIMIGNNKQQMAYEEIKKN